MYNGKKISVAMATYNGEKYIEEQLMSIINQTLPPDEIIVSDDGSKDRTLEIVEKIAIREAVPITILTDNPHHGYSGNFEWALLHTTGDYIFFSDQDDLFMPEKFCKVLDVFDRHPDAELVLHDAMFADREGKPIEGVFNWVIENYHLRLDENNTAKIDRENHFQSVAESASAHGMCMCISRKFSDSILPIPRYAHDSWMFFCSILNDSCYYLNIPLAKHRIHDNNVVGDTTRKRKPIRTLIRRIKNFFAAPSGYCHSSIVEISAKKKRAENHGYTGCKGYKILCERYEMFKKMHEAEKSNRISGAIKLIKLYRTDKWYRDLGSLIFVYGLQYVLKFSKKRRIIVAEKHLKGVII